MSRRRTLTCGFALIACLALVFLPRPSRLSAREREDAGFRIGDYLLMEDPIAAANQMLSDAQKYGIDVYRIPAITTRAPQSPPEMIRIYTHRLFIQIMDVEFSDKVERSMDNGTIEKK